MRYWTCRWASSWKPVRQIQRWQSGPTIPSSSATSSTWSANPHFKKKIRVRKLILGSKRLWSQLMRRRRTVTLRMTKKSQACRSLHHASNSTTSVSRFSKAKNRIRCLCTSIKQSEATRWKRRRKWLHLYQKSLKMLPASTLRYHKSRSHSRSLLKKSKHHRGPKRRQRAAEKSHQRSLAKFLSRVNLLKARSGPSIIQLTLRSRKPQKCKLDDLGTAQPQPRRRINLSLRKRVGKLQQRSQQQQASQGQKVDPKSKQKNQQSQRRVKY